MRGTDRAVAAREVVGGAVLIASPADALRVGWIQRRRRLHGFLVHSPRLTTPHAARYDCRHSAIIYVSSAEFLMAIERPARRSRRGASIQLGANCESAAWGGPMLFSDRSLWTMLHGIVLGG